MFQLSGVLKAVVLALAFTGTAYAAPPDHDKPGPPKPPKPPGKATTTTSSAPTSTVTWTSNPSAAPITLKVSTKAGGRNKTAPLLHGLFFEDINHSGDGGIYAELIRNRAFQGSDVNMGKIAGLPGDRIVKAENPSFPWGPTLTAWRSIGGAVLSLDVVNPLSDALQTVLRIDIPTNATGEVGFLNEGWWGMNIQPQPYNASFYVKASSALYASNLTHFTASIRSNLTNEIFASEEIPLAKNLSSFRYEQFHTVLTPNKAAPNSNNTFAITFDAEEVAGKAFFFDLVSLFPPTYKDRPNGMRKDLMETLADLNPKFLRFPGGNNLEGLSVQSRWDWKKTIGPLIERRGRPGNWGYYNSDGLGYLEYLYWCEDLNMEPLLTVYAGYSIDTTGLHPANTVPLDELEFFIQEAIEQLEYAMGDAETTYWGKKRAEHGHPEPFSIKYVEIGNEDWFSDSYYLRFPIFLEGLKKAYPNITYIASQAVENSPANRNTTLPPGTMWDLHHYQTPQFYKDNFNYFDNWNEVYNYPNVTIFVGEYSVLSRDRDGGVDWANGEGRFAYPPMVAAIGEAIFALAMERNPNVVTLSSYAPLFQNFNAYQWTPDLISFSANPNDTVLSTSYYLSKMFSTYTGTETLPIINKNGDFNPLWWHSSIDAPSGRIFVKLVNAAKDAVKLTLDLDTEVTAANATILSNEDQYGFNFLGNATAISPKEVDVSLDLKGPKKSTKKVKWDVPGYSVVVLELR